MHAITHPYKQLLTERRLYHTVTDKQRGNIGTYQLMDGYTDALERLLQMRTNCSFYWALLDTYGPGIMGYHTWNDDKNMSSFVQQVTIKYLPNMSCP